MKKQYRRRRGDSSDSDEGAEEGEMSRPPPSKVPRDSEKLDERKRTDIDSERRRGRDDERRRTEEKGGGTMYDDSRNGGGIHGSSRDGDRTGSGGIRDRDRDKERERERDRDRDRDRGRDNRRVVGDRYDTRHERRDIEDSRPDRRDMDTRRQYPEVRDRERNGRDPRGKGDDLPRRNERGDRDAEHNAGRGNRDSYRGRSGDRPREVRREDPAVDNSANSNSSKTSRGIFSYISGKAGASGGATSAGNGDTETGRQSGGQRVTRPNNAALSAIIRGDRRTNNRMDREQFDGAQTRLRNLAPEGDEVKDQFSTGCRPDLTGKKDHPFQCNICPMSYPMATQLCDHLERAHDIIRHPSLITPNKNLSVGLAADVNQP